MRTIQLARRYVRDDWGGTETVVQEVSRRLIALGHDAEVYCTLATASTPADNIDGVRVTRFPYFYPAIGLSPENRDILDRKGGSPFSFALMRALMRYPDLDLIHLHTGNRIGGIGRHVARKRRIPYVVSLHGGAFDIPAEEAASLAAPMKGSFDWGKILGMWVGSRRVMQDAGAILCVGYPESQKAQAHFPEKNVQYVPNGADTRRFARGDGQAFREARGIPRDAKVLLTVARIDTQKNQMLPARLLPELCRIDPNTHVLLIGNITNKAYHQKIEQRVAASGLSDHITIIPGIDASSQDIVDAYHAADFFLLPSIHEPFGIVILEAWSAGLPVLASRVGGIPHFVEDGKDGLLFDPADDTEFLKAFEALAGAPDRAAAIAAAGGEKAREQYDWDAVARRILSIYEDVIRENPLRK